MVALTRAQLRRRIAERIGDIVYLTATANGTTTTFIDTLRIGTQTDSMLGRDLLFTSGANSGLTRRITSFNDGTGTIGWGIAVTSTLANDTAEVYNKRGTGWLKEEYDRAINACIDEASGLGLVELVEVIPGPFDAEVPEVTVPVTLLEVFAVEWQDSDGFWHAIRPSARWDRYGWSADPGAGQIRIQGAPAMLADTANIRLSGYGRQATLAADTDSCSLDVDWMVARACYLLYEGGLDRDSGYGQKILLVKEAAERARRRLQVVRHPGTRPVRAY
jgi:hypothetical protein